MMKKILMFTILILPLLGCATGEKIRVNNLTGMTEAEVTELLGNPDGVYYKGDVKVLEY